MNLQIPFPQRSRGTQAVLWMYFVIKSKIRLLFDLSSRLRSLVSLNLSVDKEMTPVLQVYRKYSKKRYRHTKSFLNALCHKGNDYNCFAIGMASLLRM